MAIIVRNTFIDVFDESKSQLGSAQRRSSSEPPGCTFSWQTDEETSSRPQQALCDDHVESPFLSARSNNSEEHLVDTSFVSPRSDRSPVVSHRDRSPDRWPDRWQTCRSPRDVGPERSSSHPHSIVEDRPVATGLSSLRSTPDNALSTYGSVPESRDFCICISKTEQDTLGMDVKRSGGIALLIKKVSPGGLVDKWNQGNPPHLQVEAGSHIVTVNGISGRASDMLKECQRGQVFRMRVISNATMEMLVTFVETLRGFRKDAGQKICSPSKPSLSTASTTDATSQSSEAASVADDNSVCDLDVKSKSSYMWQGDTSERSNTDTLQMVPELSLVSLLPMDAAGCQSEMTPVTRCARNQPMSRTKLKSSSPIFAPSSGGKRGELVSKRGTFGEMSEVLKNTARALTVNPDVQGIRVLESESGFSAAINIELPDPRRRGPAQLHCTRQVVCKHAKNALLEVCAQSQSIYAVGYLDEPFSDIHDSSFKVTLACMRRAETACMDFYGKGRCDNQPYCCWCHPAPEEIMVVWFNIQYAVDQQ